MAGEAGPPAQRPQGNSEAIIRAGLDALRNGRAEQALPALEAAVRDNPSDARLWQMLGLLHRDLQDLSPAVSALARAAALAPADARIAHGLARATMEAGLPSISLFNRAVALAPGDLSVELGLAAALFAEGRSLEAIAGLDARLRGAPGWLLGHATVARLLWMCGDRDGFTATLERALRAEPRNAGLWQQLACTLMEGRHYERSLAVLSRARAAAGANLRFDALEAACRSDLNQISEADQLFERMAPIHEPAVVTSWVRHLLRAGRPGKAAAIAEARLAHDQDQSLWPYLAAAWRLTGDPRWNWLEGDARFVGVYDIADRVGSLPALADRLRALHLAVQQPLEQSVRGGTQTDGPLFARIEPEIRALRTAILETVQKHVAALPPPDSDHPLLAPRRAPIRFSGSWSVRLAGGGFHAEHVHPAGWFSSAFYVGVPENPAGADPHAGWLTLGQLTDLGLDLPPLRVIRPKPGRLVLFPSTMWHGTRPFLSGERLTVAFDIARPSA